jgi:hypothetical protein
MSSQTLKEFIIDISVKAAKAVNELMGVDKASDRAGKGLGDVGRAADKAGSELGRMGDKAKRASGNLAASMQSVAKKTLVVANSIATAAAPFVLSWGRASMQIARDAEEGASKFEAVYGDAAAAAGARIDELAGRLDRSPTRLRTAAADTAGQLKGIGFAARDAADMAYEATQAALDLASFSNKSGEQATRAIQGALLGNSEMLKEGFGIVVMQDQIAEELKKQGIRKVSEASQMQKTAAAMKLIRDQMQRQGSVGDAERTKDSTANRAASAEDMMFEAQVQTGKKLQALDRKIQEVKGRAAGLFLGMNDGTQGAIVGLGMLVSVMAPLASLWQLMATLKLTSALGSAGAAAGAASGGFWSLAAALLANPITWIVAAIAALAGVAYLLYKNWDTVGPWFEKLWGRIKEKLDPLIKAFGRLWEQVGIAADKIGAKLTELWNGPAGDAIRQFASFMGTVWGAELKIAWEIVKRVFSAIIAVITTAVNLIADIIKFWVAVFTGDWDGAWQAMKDTVRDVGDGIIGILEGLFPGITSRYSNWFAGFRALFRGDWEGVWLAWVAMATGAINMLIDKLGAFGSAWRLQLKMMGVDIRQAAADAQGALDSHSSQRKLTELMRPENMLPSPLPKPRTAPGASQVRAQNRMVSMNNSGNTIQTFNITAPNPTAAANAVAARTPSGKGALLGAAG